MDETFSIQKEFMVMDKVNEKVKKCIQYKWSDYFERGYHGYFSFFYISVSTIIFLCIIIIITILEIVLY